MGQEIEGIEFGQGDFDRFDERLREETARLERLFAEDAFASDGPVVGFELEACLVDAGGDPAPLNAELLERLGDPDAVPELARFDFELNSPPRALVGDVLSRMRRGLDENWAECREAAAAIGARALLVGILPTLRDEDLVPGNMSELRRYRALNEQALRLRGGRPMQLDITGVEHLECEHPDVMLEAAATSFQLHLQVPQATAVRHYNAAQIVSAPMVAAAANSPYLFGRDLWDETRIPLFEQSVALGGIAAAAQGPLRRVGFGSGYLRASMFECFSENRDHFPVLLPVALDAAVDELAHVRLHNGTIWRWNRPIIGFEAGQPHLRIEHRVLPSGPSSIDLVANAALFFGLVQALADADTPPERQLEFARARDNFYAAARFGLEAQVDWLDGRRHPLAELLREELLPLARRGLEALALDGYDIELYLGVIEARLRSGRNGAVWQRAFVARFGRDMHTLAEAIIECQARGMPVHEWPV